MVPLETYLVNLTIKIALLAVGGICATVSLFAKRRQIEWAGAGAIIATYGVMSPL